MDRVFPDWQGFIFVPLPHFGFDVAQPLTRPWKTEIICPGPSSPKGLLDREKAIVQQ